MSASRDRIDPTLLAPGSAASDTGAGAPPVLVACRYEIVALLGIGGMGRVYRAFDRELGEPVALKMLHRALVASDAMVERFRQEVRLARRVTHKNVARTFDIGEHDGEKYLTMELVEGESLATRLERGLLPIEETLRIARAIALGIGAAHDVGVVHRDLKPDNVMLEQGGRVVVTDFGIARAEVPEKAWKTQGQTVGTPAYMAPEQIGASVPLDGRADIYAFGALLFEMLTGRLAWTGNTPIAVAAARLIDPPPDPSAFRPGLSPALAALVLRCMAREREDRFPSVAELSVALASIDVSDVPTPAPAAPRGAPRERTVALVPFRDLGAAEDASFVEGLTEDLVDALATVRGLRVRGRAYAEAGDRDVVDTGRRLGVDVIVEGSVRRAGEMLRVSARVIGVADGFQLWSSRFERPLGDVFALNDEVARGIAAALSGRADAGQARAPISNTAAIELYFRGRQAMSRFWLADQMTEARRLFSESLALAPDDPTILAGAVIAQIGRNLAAPLPRGEALPLVRRALTAGHQLAEPWVALAAFRFNHDDDPGGALRALGRALELAPGSADAHDLSGRILLEVGEVEEAGAHLERALWFDPRQQWARIDLMRVAALGGDFERAQKLYDEGPGPEWIGHRLLHRTRIWSWPGAPDEPVEFPENTTEHMHAFIEMFRRARELRRCPEPQRPEELVAAYAAAIDTAGPRGRRFIRQLLAEALAVAGFMEESLTQIELAAQDGLLDRAWITRLRLFDSLRGDPRFEAAAARVVERASRAAAGWTEPTERVEEALASLA